MFFCNFYNKITYTNNMKNNCIVLTGGGTAGHVTLNINLETELKKYFDKIVYIGSQNGIEKSLIKNNTTYNYREITTVKLERKKILKNLTIPQKLFKGIKEAKKILQEVKPNVVFSKGGYVGLPVVIAAHKLNIPVICHESDISMGLANKIAKKYAKIICTNFKITAEKNGKKCIHTGMPIMIKNLTKNQAKEKLNIKTTKPILLVTGGSLGAQSINNFIYKNIEKLTQKYYVYHLVGKNNLNISIKNNSYKQVEFSNDMWTIYKAADYAISRAGANTIVELLANNILTIFIPLPKKASRGDQIQNAKYLENSGLSKTILQEDLTLEKLQNCLNFLENNAKNIKNNIKNANFQNGTQKIIDIILQEKNT